ncbi:MAG TPA: glycosyltransferase [Candidatus Limnocylindrales bacterium]|nr:glycosyltransferase [Candidatus Limnocylindrales bacterium]
MTPAVSVIVPTWQRHDLLQSRCLPSILAQDASLECLVVSDGRDDLAEAIVDDFADPRLRYLTITRPTYPADPVERKCSQGAAAINAGLDAARGAWITITGDDDEFVPDGLAVLLDAAEPEDDILFGRSNVRQRDGRWAPVGDGPPRFRAFPTGGAIVRRSRLGSTRLDPLAYQRGLHAHADTDFWMRLAAAGFRFRAIASIVFRYYPSAYAAA